MVLSGIVDKAPGVKWFDEVLRPKARVSDSNGGRGVVVKLATRFGDEAVLRGGTWPNVGRWWTSERR